MPQPTHCTNPECRCYYDPAARWKIRDGWYHSRCGGAIQRYRCRYCSRRLSDQSESIHLYAKRRLRLAEIFARIRGGSSLRDIARSEHCSPTAISGALLRLGRQSMAAHLRLLCGAPASKRLVFDGLLSCCCSQDYPATITTVVDGSTEMILAMSHGLSERSGRRTAAQQQRMRAKRRVFRPHRGSLHHSIALLVHEMARFIDPSPTTVIDTDCHRGYRALLRDDPVFARLRAARMCRHRTTSSTVARTTANPLFAVNLVDRLLRHRMKEHTRETIAFARNATSQMHRAWIFAFDHNYCQPHRVASGSPVTRAQRLGISPTVVRSAKRSFFTTRLDMAGVGLPRSIEQVWSASLQTPPVRWICGQSTHGPLIPAYAIRDLTRAYLHAP